MEVETSFGAETQGNAEVGPDGKVKAGVGEVDGLSIDVTGKPTAEAPPKPEGTTPEAPKPEEGAPETTAAPLEDLGEYKADAQEVVAKFDARYFTPEGVLNRDTLSAEFWGNATAAAEGVPALVGKLNDSTYAYLADRLGVSKELVNEIEQGLVARRTLTTGTHTAAVHAIAGTPERYNAAMAWGATGYTDAQRARFDEVVRTQAPGWEDAVTALMARYDAANPSAQRMPNLRRASTPARDATEVRAPGAITEPAAVPFADEAAYHQALREVSKLRPGAEQARAGEEVRKRLRASPFARRTL